MTVNATLTPALIAEKLGLYQVGTLQHFQACQHTRQVQYYELETQSGKYLACYYTQLSELRLEIATQLMSQLAEQGFSCPAPVATQNGQYWVAINDKPLLLCRYPGGMALPQEQLGPHQLEQIGSCLGSLHLLLQHIEVNIPQENTLPWSDDTLEAMLTVLPNHEALLIQEEIGYQKIIPKNILPQGLIHSLPTPANLLWQDKQLSALINYSLVRPGCLLFDLAIAANTCCLDENQRFDPLKVDIMLQAYQQHRELTPMELRHWLNLRRVAALHAWLGDLTAWYHAPQLMPKEHPRIAFHKHCLMQLSSIPNLA